ncbi:multidrug efflux SMR transporter [Paenibacillus sp. WQ 127069]|uniref:Multidrug efflux SMR transporter n=1 Tax=Paenibacillus baimaensis TaxID=2982185 RepID=A0ABT2UT42_9BACL|nr:multidrug efflux SMR transporter [Paenibacillus sp. WQ 127069]MCU6797790.1 multidrug efflux SMR transporter [Paenibacillus sp. WQ 127069]
MNRYWIYVVLSGILEIVWVTGLKHSETALEWTATAVAIVISFLVIILAARRLPVGTVYAVFAGIGTSGTVLVEMLIFGEPFNVAKIMLIAVLLAGVIGLKIVTTEETGTEAERGSQ